MSRINIINPTNPPILSWGAPFISREDTIQLQQRQATAFGAFCGGLLLPSSSIFSQDPEVSWLSIACLLMVACRQFAHLMHHLACAQWEDLNLAKPVYQGGGTARPWPGRPQTATNIAPFAWLQEPAGLSKTIPQKTSKPALHGNHQVSAGWDHVVVAKGAKDNGQAEELAKQISNQTAPEEGPSGNGQPEQENFLLELIAMVQQNIGNVEFSTSDLYRCMTMSSSKLHRKVKEVTDMKPSQIIRFCRLHMAKSLLLNTDASITDISVDTGFSDPAYFSRIFAKEFGMSPSKFRKINQPAAMNGKQKTNMQ